MALSEHEQRLLEEMERNLYRNDADVLGTLGGNRRQPNYAAIAWGALLGVAGLGLMLVGVSASLALLGILGFAVLFAGVMIAITVPGRPVGGAGTLGGMSAPTTKAAGFMNTLNDRWERRQRGEAP